MTGDPDAGLAVEVAQRDDGAAVRVVGEIDLSTAPALAAAVERVALSAGARLVLDLRDVSFMDSSGIQLLMRFDLRARSEGWELVVVRNRGGAVDRLLELCRIAERVRTISDPAELS